MKFSDLQYLLKEKLGIDHLADIARELSVSPQAVSNWKARDRVPYKYVVNIREKLKLLILELENNQPLSIKLDILYVYRCFEI